VVRDQIIGGVAREVADLKKKSVLNRALAQRFSVFKWCVDAILSPPSCLASLFTLVLIHRSTRQVQVPAGMISESLELAPRLDLNGGVCWET
jgi:hypothetical protein